MNLRHKACKWCVRPSVIYSILTVLLLVPLVASSEAVTLVVNGPQTAREGDLIEYRLRVVNDGADGIAGLQVLYTLPAKVDFVEASLKPVGSYDPASGIWILPILGTGEDDNAAGLVLQALVHPNLLLNPDEVVSVTSRAEVIAPPLTDPVKTKLVTNIVCAFCIDWEIVSVRLDSDFRGEDTWELPETRFYLYVDVANNGPVMSSAILTTTHFEVVGGDFGPMNLDPALPFKVSLDVGETLTVGYATDWEYGGSGSDYTISWAFEISDDSLLDPVLPNTSTGSWSGDVEDGDSGGCTVNEAAAIDPVWLFMLGLSGLFYARRKMILKAARSVRAG
ncbi:MAG: JDVT-CTERM domain-containing protein [Gammaproteobacteria bacterium]